MIEALTISKKYGRTTVLNEVNFSIKDPSIIALLGPNGSGKSTLLRCLSLIEFPDAGIIKMGNKKFEFPSIEEIDSNIWPDITLVFQQFFLWPNFNIKDNILLPVKNRFPDSYQAIYMDTIQKFELENLLKKFPNQISVGQKQKVALARTIALKPKILLLDEITSALDNLHASKIALILRELKEQGTAIILVTHSINFAIHLADEYAVLEQGKIVEWSNIKSISKPTSEYLKQSITSKGYLI